MNYAIVLRLLSYILYCEAALLLLPANDEARVGHALELAAGAVRLAPEAPQPRPLLFGAVE